MCEHLYVGQLCGSKMGGHNFLLIASMSRDQLASLCEVLLLGDVHVYMYNMDRLTYCHD